jgi:site-specific recombinase XerD
VLNLYRRHTPKCPHKSKGQDYIKCNCPVWCYGQGEDGKQIRESLKTCDWGRAGRRAAKLESPDARRFKPVAEAVTAFKQHRLDLQPATQAKQDLTLRYLQEHCDREGLRDLDEITVEHLDSFRFWRKLGPLSAMKELERLRCFFGFCIERGWMKDNPAKRIKTPRNIKPAEVVPYEPNEVAKMIAACDAIGRCGYERLRARALVLLLRYTALRITDAITLPRDALRENEIRVRTQKNGQPVSVWVPSELVAALRALPLPRGASEDCRYFFWSGNCTKRAISGSAERTLTRVFKKADVKGAHAHRFRHTLATDLLAKGATFEDVADILGNSPNIVRKHYAKWSRARQERITELMQSVYGSCTNPVREENVPVVN